MANDTIGRQHFETRRLFVLFAVVYFSQAMWNLPGQPLSALLMNSFGYNSTAIDQFRLIIAAPWFIKPLYGLFFDTVPFLGRHRKSYFVLMSLLAIGTGLLLAFIPAGSLLVLGCCLFLLGLWIAGSDVIIDALMVEKGQPTGLTGTFQAVQWAALNFGFVTVGIWGGWLAENVTISRVFLIVTVVPLLSLIIGSSAIRETANRAAAPRFKESWQVIKLAGNSRRFWLAAGLISLYYFTPTLGSSVYTYSIQRLGFDDFFFGGLQSLTQAAAVVGAALYFIGSRFLSLKLRLYLGIALGTLSGLIYLFYDTRQSAAIVSLIAGALGMLAELAFLDLAARVCPRTAEAFFFAFLMSIANLGTHVSGILGDWMYNHWGYSTAIVIGAAATACSWILVPFLRFEELDTPV